MVLINFIEIKDSLTAFIGRQTMKTNVLCVIFVIMTSQLVLAAGWSKGIVEGEAAVYTEFGDARPNIFTLQAQVDYNAREKCLYSKLPQRLSNYNVTQWRIPYVGYKTIVKAYYGCGDYIR